MSKPKRVNPFMRVAQAVPDVPIIYVSGPVSSHADLNRPAFIEAERRLRDAGYFSIIPHIVVDPDTPWLQAMAACVNALSKADGVALLDGWEDSDGAKIEVMLADRGGLPIATVDEWCEGARHE